MLSLHGFLHLGMRDMSETSQRSVTWHRAPRVASNAVVAVVVLSCDVRL